MERIEAPAYQVWHNDPSTTNRSTTTAIDQTITLSGAYGSLPGGIYIADRVQITDTYLNIFEPTAEIINHWPRLSTTNGLSAASPVTGFHYGDFDFTLQDNVASVTVTTFTWHITSAANGQNLDIWLPAPPAEIQTAYSLHVFDERLTNTKEASTQNAFEIYPNPTTESINLLFQSDLAATGTIQIVDAQGRILKTLPLTTDQTQEINITGLPNGLYLCQILTDTGLYTHKFVKQ